MLTPIKGGKRQILVAALDRYEEKSPFAFVSVGLTKGNLDTLQKYFDTTNTCLEQSNISSISYEVSLAYPVHMPTHVGMWNLLATVRSEKDGWYVTSEPVELQSTEFPSILEVSRGTFRFLVTHDGREYRSIWLPQDSILNA